MRIIPGVGGRRWASALGFSLAVLLAGSSGFAQEIPATQSEHSRLIKKDLPEILPGQEVRVGVFRLHPSMEASMEYDDNIRLSDSGEKGDVIFREMPGIIAEVRPAGHRFSVGYGAEMLQFADVAEENAVNHLALGSAEIDLGHLQIDVKDIVDDSTSRLHREDSSRDQTLRNEASVNGRLVQGKWVLEGGWRNNLMDHKPARSSDDDYAENIGAVLLGHKVAPKTALFIEASVGEVDYDSNAGNADHDYWQVMAGLGYREHFRKYDEEEGRVERAAHAKINAALRLGFQDRDLSDVAGRAAQDGFDGLVSDSFFQYRPTASESIFLGYTATAHISTFQTNEWYRQDKVSFAWKKRLLRKLYVIPRFSWTRNDYPERSTVAGVTDEREDDILQFQPELRYEPRVDEVTGEAWMWASLTFTFRNRDSNLDGVDFDNNKVAVRLGFSY